MPKPRTPKAKAEVSGAALHDPQRYRGRKSPKNTRPLGQPYVSMTEPERKVWAELEASLPWLHSGHRLLVRSACLLAARMDSGEIGVSAIHALSSILSKLGATPVDESRIDHAGEEDEDDSAEFFGRPH